MSNKATFVENNWIYAVNAYKRFGMNPIVILAQSAEETGWGTSYSATNRNNYFGFTAGGSPNEFWTGRKSMSTKSKLWFREYDAPQLSFYDFARLIKSKYPSSFAVNANLEAYATAISQSPYINEKNGDSRSKYRANIISHGTYIARYAQERGLLITANAPTTNSNKPNKALIIGVSAAALLLVSAGVLLIMD